MDTIVKNTLLLLKLDAEGLFSRIKLRFPEYMQIFSAKRSREHFADIFKNRYDRVGIPDLSHCGEEVIVELDRFYSSVEQLHWYLLHTQELPGIVEDKVAQNIRELEKSHETLQLYIQAELTK